MITRYDVICTQLLCNPDRIAIVYLGSQSTINLWITWTLCEPIPFKRWHFRVSEVTEGVFKIKASNLNLALKLYVQQFLGQAYIYNSARATRLSLQIRISLFSNCPLGNWAQDSNVTFETFKCHLLKWIVINNYHTVWQYF